MVLLLQWNMRIIHDCSQREFDSCLAFVVYSPRAIKDNIGPAKWHIQLDEYYLLQSRRARSFGERIEISSLGLCQIDDKVALGHIVVRDGAVDARRGSDRPRADAEPKRGVVVVGVDRAAVPGAAAFGAEKVGRPVGRVGRRRLIDGNGRVLVRDRRVVLAGEIGHQF